MTEPIPFDLRRKPKACDLDVEHVGTTQRIKNQSKTPVRCRNCKMGKLGFDTKNVYSQLVPGIRYEQHELDKRGQRGAQERRDICLEDQYLQRFEE